jgi:hypothetical protein
MVTQTKEASEAHIVPWSAASDASVPLRATGIVKAFGGGFDLV